MWTNIKEDVLVALEKDPSSRSFWEVLVCYPGVHALLLHRVAHSLWSKGFQFPGRLLSFFGRWLTGIEIHPGARIGRRFFIDHGMGVVVGETAEVGDNVFVYHGVTLGGISMKRGKRHPTVGDNVVIGANAQVLGPIKIGKNSKIGAGSVVLQDVPEYSTVIGVPGRVVFSGVCPVQEEEGEGNELTFPDPVARAIECMLEKLPKMEKEIRSLRETIDRLQGGNPAVESSDPSRQTPSSALKKVSGGSNP
jgi:serine O-acetyltransferase